MKLTFGKSFLFAAVFRIGDFSKNGGFIGNFGTFSIKRAFFDRHGLIHPPKAIKDWSERIKRSDRSERQMQKLKQELSKLNREVLKVRR